MKLPLGVIVNSISVFCGGMIGASVGKWVPDNIREALPRVFAVCALALGVTFIVEVRNLPPVVLALIVGTALGEMLDIEGRLKNFSKMLQQKVGGATNAGIDQKAVGDLVTLLVLFSLSVSYIIGSLHEGLSGDTTFLAIKSILDFFTAIIFAASIGYGVMLLSVSTLFVGVVFFGLASVLMPLISDVMIADFAAGGGIVTLLIGIQMMGHSEVPVANTLPSIVLIMPFSYLWTLFF